MPYRARASGLDPDPEHRQECLWYYGQRAMGEQFSFDVFLSHSSKDKAVVRDVAERLRKDGLRVWLDEWVLRPGDSIPAKIEEGLEQSRVLVLCMSAQAFGSDWARLESGTFRFHDALAAFGRYGAADQIDTARKS